MEVNGGIFEAARYGSLSYMIELLRDGADANAKNDLGESVISIAAAAGHVDLVWTLLTGSEGPIMRNWDTETPLELMADPDPMDKDERTPLSHAAENNWEEIVSLLQKSGQVNPNSSDKNGWTPLAWAVTSDSDWAATQLLEDNRVNPNPKDKDSRTPLSHAAEKNMSHVVRLLLAKSQVNPDSKDNDDRTPLSYAAENGSIETVELLLAESQVNINSQDKVGRTPFSYAMTKQSKDVAELLLEDPRLKPDLADDNKKTPLLWAIGWENNNIITSLVRDARVNPNSKDSAGRTPLSYAAEIGWVKGVASLLKSDMVWVDSKDSTGRTPLSYAAGKGHTRTAGALCWDVRVSVDSPDKSGLTPLSWASRNGCAKTVAMLLSDYHADPARRDGQGWTPLWWAAKNLHYEVVDLLVEKDDTALFTLIREENHALVWRLLRAGYNVNLEDDDGKTPLQWAVQQKDRDMIEILLEVNATSKGIMAEEWRRVYGTVVADIVQLTTEGDEKESVNLLTADQLSDAACKTGTDTRFFAFKDETRWSLIPTQKPVSDSTTRSLQLSAQRVGDGHDVEFSGSFQFHVGQHDAYQKYFGVRDTSRCRIAWKRRAQKSSDDDFLKQVVYFSTLPQCWIPKDEFDFLELFLHHVEEKWLNLCREAKDHLAALRLEQLRRQGKSPEMMHILAKDAEMFAHLRVALQDQVSHARETIAKYTRLCHAKHCASLESLLSTDLEGKVGEQIGQLDQGVRDLLQIEFAWASVTEARISTRLAQNVMLLTYVSIFYIPLAFCAALWAIPGITNSSIRTPFIVTSVVIGIITFGVAFNLDNIVAVAASIYQKWRHKVITSMQRDSEWKEKGDELQPFNVLPKTASEWWIWVYMASKLTRTFTRWLPEKDSAKSSDSSC